jgi:UDP-glucose 4-epimerase
VRTLGGVDLVTGGAGFIGSELVGQLVNAGRRVVVLDDLTTGRAENLRDVPRDRVDLVVGDVRDDELAAACIREVDTVYHLACVNLRRSLHEPEAAHAVNATGTLTLLEVARRVGVGRWVHVSSSEVYGSARCAPMDEAHPTEPTTAYGASKLAGEAYARAHHRTHGLPVVIVRPFNAYGPHSHHEGDSGEVIPKFVLRALAGRPLTISGSGSQTRDFTHVADIAAGIRAAGTAPGVVGSTFNLGSGSEVSITDLARVVVALVGSPDVPVVHGPSRPGDVEALCADASRARRVLGFAPSRALADGVRDLAGRFRAEPRGIDALLAEEEVGAGWEHPRQPVLAAPGASPS